MPKIFEYEGLDYEVPDDTTLSEFESFIDEKEAAERSAAMGGPFLTAEEQALEDYEALTAARAKQEREAMGRPSFLPETFDDVAEVERKIAARQNISTPGGPQGAPYLDARVAPGAAVLRPTKIEDVRILSGGETPTERRVRSSSGVRPPTEMEELVEAFARQPIMTREAGRQLAEGIPADQVRKKVGELEGAVMETPMQAFFRAMPAAVEGAATEIYQRLPIVGDAPVTNLYTRYLASLSDHLAKLEERGAGATGEMRPSATSRELSAIPTGSLNFLTTIPGKIARGLEAVGNALDTAPLAGQGGISATSRELAAIQPKLPQPAIPAPAAIPDKPLSQRIREGETFADVIRSDPQTVEVYDREYGGLAPLAIEGAGLALSLPLPFTPVGAALDVARVTGATKAAAKVATNKLTQRAVAKVDQQLATDLWKSAVASDLAEIPSDLRLDNIVNQVEAHHARLNAGLADQIRAAVPQATPVLIAQAIKMLKAEQAADISSIVARLPQARADLARVAPRTDLIRVSPSYAVPQSIAARVTAEVADGIKALREADPTLSLAELSAKRDEFVKKAAQAEAKRLDELGQLQVLLDGLDTPRVWDGDLARSARAFYSPEDAMKRASVTAAEMEVARKGMDTLRQFRKEVEARSAQGQSLDQILLEVGQRELADVPPKEIAKKVLEEAYGPERARTLTGLEGLGLQMLSPEFARAKHAELVRTQAVPAMRTPPNFAANALKIIMEEGTRKRVSKQALDDYARMYPDSPRPTLALWGTVGPLKADALRTERKFFENGAEETFRLVESIPTRAQGTAPSVFEASERLAATMRNIRAKVRVPVLAEAQLLMGEQISAPVRAYLTTRYGLPTTSVTGGIATPYGFLRTDDVTTMINDLGGFGPSRMDLERKGSLVSDIFLAASKRGQEGKIFSNLAEKQNYLKDMALGRPVAYAAAEAIEMGYRRGVFEQALQQGRTPEAAMELARRSQFDYGSAQDVALIDQLAPYWAGAVQTAAAAKEFIDRTARDPGRYRIYLRALREQQRLADPEGVQGDSPLTRFYVPIPDDMSRDIFGRELDVLGPAAPGLQPIGWSIGAAKVLQGIQGLGGLVLDGRVIEAALDGSTEALDEVSTWFGSLSSAFGGAVEAPKTTKRAKGTAAIDQTYMALLALARAHDPDRSLGVQQDALNFLQPKVATPPKAKAAFDYAGAKAWSERPPSAPGAYIYSEFVPNDPNDLSAGMRRVWYLLQPSKEGRQRIQSLETLPLSDIAFGPLRALGTAVEEGAGEGVLWLIGAETVEGATKTVVDQTR